MTECILKAKKLDEPCTVSDKAKPSKPDTLLSSRDATAHAKRPATLEFKTTTGHFGACRSRSAQGLMRGLSLHYARYGALQPGSLRSGSVARPGSFLLCSLPPTSTVDSTLAIHPPGGLLPMPWWAGRRWSRPEMRRHWRDHRHDHKNACKSMSAAEVGNSMSKAARTSGCTVPKTPIFSPDLLKTSAHRPSRKVRSLPCLML